MFCTDSSTGHSTTNEAYRSPTAALKRFPRCRRRPSCGSWLAASAAVHSCPPWSTWSLPWTCHPVRRRVLCTTAPPSLPGLLPRLHMPGRTRRLALLCIMAALQHFADGCINSTWRRGMTVQTSLGCPERLAIRDSVMIPTAIIREGSLRGNVKE